MNLFDECLEVLGSEGKVLSEDQDLYFETMVSLFPFSRWGRIDWPQVKDHIALNSVSDVLLELRKRNKQVHDDVIIIWDDLMLPAVKSNLVAISRHIDAVTAVAFDTWIFNVEEKYVIEFYHEGDIRLGFSNILQMHRANVVQRVCQVFCVCDFIY